MHGTMNIKFEEILSRARGNSEEQNKVLGVFQKIINYCTINIYYNYTFFKESTL